jgi:hypothetical protein
MGGMEDVRGVQDVKLTRCIWARLGRIAKYKKVKNKKEHGAQQMQPVIFLFLCLGAAPLLRISVVATTNGSDISVGLRWSAWARSTR